MSNWMISAFFAAGVAGWSYTMLVRSNGNPIPSQNYAGAAIAFVVVFVLLWTLLEYVLNF